MTTIFRMALERAGFHVDTFNDPVLALRNFRPKLYDLVFDIIMPGIDGFELYKQIKKQDPDVLMCFLTASEKYRQELRKEEYCTLNKHLFFKNQYPLKT